MFAIIKTHRGASRDLRLDHRPHDHRCAKLFRLPQPDRPALSLSPAVSKTPPRAWAINNQEAIKHYTYTYIYIYIYIEREICIEISKNPPKSRAFRSCRRSTAPGESSGFRFRESLRWVETFRRVFFLRLPVSRADSWPLLFCQPPLSGSPKPLTYVYYMYYMY